MPSFKKSQSLPVLYVRGTHYEVGYQMGRTFKALINDYVNEYKILEKLLKVYETDKGRKAYEAAFQAVKEAFPQYLDELQGISDGCDIPIHKLFILHDISVICDVGGIEHMISEGAGCTSILVNLRNNAYLGHNEDADIELLNNTYVIHAHIESGTKETEEKFVAYCYAGDVPGFCMGYNHHGFVFSINVLHPLVTIPGKIPPHFYCRALLGMRNIEEAINLLKNKGLGCSDGFSVNMCYIGKSAIQMCNVEIAPHQKDGHSIIHIHNVPEGEYYVHCNKYLSIATPENEEIASSEQRHLAISKLESPKDLKTICHILGDKSNSEYPVFRYPNMSDRNTATLGTGIFDLHKLTWSVYTSNPKSQNEPLMVLPIYIDESSGE